MNETLFEIKTLLQKKPQVPLTILKETDVDITGNDMIKSARVEKRS